MIRNKTTVKVTCHYELIHHCEGKQSHCGGTPNHREATEIIVNFTKSHYKGYTKSYLSTQKMIVKVI